MFPHNYVVGVGGNHTNKNGSSMLSVNNFLIDKKKKKLLRAPKEGYMSNNRISLSND